MMFPLNRRFLVRTERSSHIINAGIQIGDGTKKRHRICVRANKFINLNQIYGEWAETRPQGRWGDL